MTKKVAKDQTKVAKTADVRPLTASERNALLKVARGRFDALRGELKLEADKAILRADEEVMARYQGIINEFNSALETQIIADIKTLNLRLDDLMSWGRQNGLDYKGHWHPHVSLDKPVPIPRALKELQQTLGQRITLELQRASVALTRQQSQVEEAILISGIESSTARDLLAAIPTLESLVDLNKLISDYTGALRLPGGSDAANVVSPGTK